ncbi:MAG: diadenylate cyclase CdaA [Muribaculaceae bacterium]|nr:diadenylate cyclase CdaA [Muribaculaceae bacterium]
MLGIGIKDIIDILLVALLLFYVYRLMRRSGTISLFYGVLAFIVIWVLASEIFDMRLTGTILDKFMSIGLIVLVILFQDQIKRFLIDIGSRSRWKNLRKLLLHGRGEDTEEYHESVMAIVRACMAMSRTKTGALIVIQRKVPLSDYEKTGEILNAPVNARLLESIFFKNSPLHDGAVIIADGIIKAAGCILPVSHDMDIPKELGLRHRSALGMSQATDALCVIVSEETGNISVASAGKFQLKVSGPELESILRAR